MTNDSILKQEIVETILSSAKKNVEQEGKLHPMLFLRLSDGNTYLRPVDLPETADGRARVFFQLGILLRIRGTTILEALFLSEGWFVQVQDAKADLAVPPSEHPRRVEAIVIVGRDARNLRTTSVIQPFRREVDGKLLWQPLAQANYDEPVEAAGMFDSLLDNLFIKVETAPPN